MVASTRKNILASIMGNWGRLQGIRGDISGGLTTAIITLPMAVAYGIIAYSPLGADFAPFAALSGVYAAVFAGFLATLFGSCPIQITGPMLPLTLVLSTFVGGLVTDPAFGIQPTVIFGLTSLCVFFAGCIQVVFSFLGLTNLVKYVPQPVVAGFINGIGLLVIVKQLQPLLGVDGSVALADYFTILQKVNPVAVTTGLTTILAMFMGRKFLKIIPPTLAGLICGIGVYYFVRYVVKEAPAVQLIGSLPTAMPKPDVVTALFYETSSISFASVLPPLLLTSLVVSLIGMMESLLGGVVCDNLLVSRHNSKKEIIGLGIGNIAGSLFGAIASGGSILRSTANFKAGGRTKLSGMLNSVIILMMALVLGPQASKVPIAVFAGIIFVVGVNMLDRWTLAVLRRLLFSFTCPKEVRVDICISVFVTVITVSVNLIAAVVIGVIVASFLFISKLGRSVLKRNYCGDSFHSRKMRPLEHLEYLEKEGNRISILQLQGPIFFGLAENLAERVQQAAMHGDYILLDFKRVTEVDSTGSSILLRVEQAMQKTGKYLLFTNIQNNRSIWPFLQTMNFGDSLAEHCLFADTDSALEWAEERLLDSGQYQTEITGNFKKRQLALFEGFNKTEMNEISALLHYKIYRKGEKVFAEGDTSRDLYILMKGLMTVSIYLPERGRCKRLFTYSPGVVFGEMAFLDGRSRSAQVVASEASEVYCLQFDDFELLCNQHPDISNKLLRNIALEISHRLRRTSAQVRDLEEN